MQLITSLAVLATAVSTAQAMGKAILYNKCSQDVYIWATDSERDPQQPTVVKKGGEWSEGYVTPSSGGVSIKISKTTSKAAGKITQFEYTMAPAMDMVFYDGSNVDCQDKNCPFWQEGMYLKTSDSSCPTRTCHEDEVTCAGFYTYWNNDLNTIACADSADTILYLCATSDSGSDDSSPAAPASSSAAASSSIPVPSVVQAARVDVSSIPAVASSATSTSSAAVTTTSAPSPTPTSSVVQMNEAPATTFITYTKTTWKYANFHPRASKRAEHAHAHARRHGHQH